MGDPINIPAVNILLLDDHSLVSEGLKALLMKMIPEGCMIQVFDSIEKAKQSLREYRYSFVLTDLMMPGQQVPQFITHIRSAYPEIMIIVITSVIDSNTVKEFLALGVHGYLSKCVGPDEIKLAFENAYKGRVYISSDLTGRFASNVLSLDNTTLTKKELEVLRLLAAGHATRMVAEKLFISPVTVMTHKRNLMQKLNLHSIVGLVKYAYDNHLL